MVGNGMLSFLYQRLQEIKGNFKDPFGGVHVILVGDLFQLRPVGDGWIFSDCSFGYAALAPNLWQSYFKMFELTEIMRQKDDVEFAQLLNRLREGSHTAADLHMLKSRGISPTDANYQNIKEELHLYPCNAAVDEHNEAIFTQSMTEKTEIKCRDSVLGEDSKEVKDRILQQIKGKKMSETGNLSEKLKVAVELYYDTTHNISVDDGICNGTPCVLKKIEYFDKNNHIPSVLWVEFPELDIGRNTRYEYRRYFTSNVLSHWTPIWAEKKDIYVSNFL